MANPALDARQLDGEGEFLRGDALLDLARQVWPGPMLLSFSTGKDSLAAWLWLRERGVEVVPYFLYLIPGLSYIERALDHYEQFFGQHIIRLPHPRFYQLLNDYVWQIPETAAAIRVLDLPNYDYADVDNWLAADRGLTDPACAMGIRRADGLDRRRLIDQMGVVGLGTTNKRRFYYPLWDWKLDDVVSIILRYGAKLAPEYDLFGRTVVALTYRRLRPVKDCYPEDYQKILDWFPLAELELFRYETVGTSTACA